MKIRHARPEDAVDIHEVASVSWASTYENILSEETIESVVEDWYAVKDLRKQIEDPLFYVAENTHGEITGFVHATTEGETAKLHRIYLKPKHQGERIGSQLYQKVEGELNGKADRIRLEVLTENKKANSFYQSKGFEKQKEEKIELKGEKLRQNILIKQF